MHWDGCRITRAAITPRPLPPIERLLAGRRAAEAVRMVPLLYGLCGKAQQAAAVQACEAAGGVACAASTARERELMVLGEALHEHCWRVLLNWPALFGVRAAPEVLKAVNAALRAALSGTDAQGAARLEQVVSERVLGMPLSAWLEAEDPRVWWALAAGADTGVGAMLRCLAEGDGDWGRSAVPLLPQLQAREAREAMAPLLMGDATFADRPRWRGEPHETGPIARLADHPAVAGLLRGEGNGVRARLLIRITELAAIARYIRTVEAATGQGPGWVRATPVAEGMGLAWVETARGRLMHMVQLCGDRIARYRIVAPTEWNFAADGACARGLAGCPAPDEATLRRRAALTVTAIDPCVGYTVYVHHA